MLDATPHTLRIFSVFFCAPFTLVFLLAGGRGRRFRLVGSSLIVILVLVVLAGVESLNSMVLDIMLVPSFTVFERRLVRSFLFVSSFDIVFLSLLRIFLKPSLRNNSSYKVEYV